MCRNLQKPGVEARAGISFLAPCLPRRTAPCSFTSRVRSHEAVTAVPKSCPSKVKTLWPGAGPGTFREVGRGWHGWAWPPRALLPLSRCSQTHPLLKHHNQLRKPSWRAQCCAAATKPRALLTLPCPRLCKSERPVPPIPVVLGTPPGLGTLPLRPAVLQPLCFPPADGRAVFSCLSPSLHRPMGSQTCLLLCPQAWSRLGPEGPVGAGRRAGDGACSAQWGLCDCPTFPDSLPPSLSASTARPFIPLLCFPSLSGSHLPSPLVAGLLQSPHRRLGSLARGEGASAAMGLPWDSAWEGQRLDLLPSSLCTCRGQAPTVAGFLGGRKSLPLRLDRGALMVEGDCGRGLRTGEPASREGGAFA